MGKRPFTKVHVLAIWHCPTNSQLLLFLGCLTFALRFRNDVRHNPTPKPTPCCTAALSRLASYRSCWWGPCDGELDPHHMPMIVRTLQQRSTELVVPQTDRRGYRGFAVFPMKRTCIVECSLEIVSPVPRTNTLDGGRSVPAPFHCISSCSMEERHRDGTSFELGHKQP